MLVLVKDAPDAAGTARDLIYCGDDPADVDHEVVVQIEAEALDAGWRDRIRTLWGAEVDWRPDTYAELTDTLNLRLGPDQHQRAALSAGAHGMSLNSWIMQAVEEKASR